MTDPAVVTRGVFLPQCRFGSGASRWSTTIGLAPEDAAARVAKLQVRENTLVQGNARHGREFLAQEQTKSKQRMVGLYEVGAGLAGVCAVSRFPAHFAVEDRMRLLRRVVVGVRGERGVDSLSADAAPTP